MVYNENKYSLIIMKKDILKSIIYKLIINKINQIINLKISQNPIGLGVTKTHGFNKLSNNKSKLQIYNTSNDNIHNIYKYNNNNIINNILKNNIISNILVKYFNAGGKINHPALRGNLDNTRSKGSFPNFNYIISKPIYKDTNNKLNIILFIYNKYKNSQTQGGINNNILLIRMINNITESLKY